MKPEAWEVEIANSITGPRFAWGRRGGRGPKLRAHETPKYVRDYLFSTEMGWMGVSIETFKEDPEFREVDKGRYRGTIQLEGPEVRRAQEIRRRQGRFLHSKKGIIRSPIDLARYLGGDDSSPERIESSIKRRIYKDTECGCCCSVTLEGFSVAGYAEGSDGQCPDHEVLFPCREREIDDAIREADAEGCEAWEEANEPDPDDDGTESTP